MQAEIAELEKELSLHKDIIVAHQIADETGYIDGVGWVDNWFEIDATVINLLQAHNLEQQLKILKEYANTCGVLRQEPSTRGLHELIMDLEAKALKVGK